MLSVFMAEVLCEPELILQNDKIMIFQKQLGQWENLNYLIVCCNSRKSCVIDPFESVYWLNFCRKNNFVLTEVWLTHSHFDHVRGVDELHERLGHDLVIRCHELEQDRGYKPKYIDWWTHAEFSEISCYIGEAQFSVHCTPGHTPGHTTFIGCGAIITGDCLFLGSCGRTDLFGGSVTKQRHSLQYLAEIFTKCSSQDLILPGHRYPLLDGRTPSFLPYDEFSVANEAMAAIFDDVKWENLPFLSFDDDLAKNARKQE